MDILITNKLIEHVQGKKIKDIKYENFYKGEYSLDYTVVLDNLDKINNSIVTKADSNTLFLSNGYVVTFGYGKDGIKYFPDISQAEIMNRNKKFITGGFAFIFVFEDDSCLVVSVNSWMGSFRVQPQSDYKPSNKISPYDREKFTIDVFRQYFTKNIGVIGVCGTSKGFIDVERNFIHEALFRSKIHPKTKASKLTHEEVENLYKTILILADEYLLNGGINETVNVKAVGNPCPVCRANFEKGNAYASSIFFCPNCQKEKY